MYACTVKKFPGAQFGAIVNYFRIRSQVSRERIEISTSEKRRYQLQYCLRLMK